MDKKICRRSNELFIAGPMRRGITPPNHVTVTLSIVNKYLVGLYILPLNVSFSLQMRLDTRSNIATNSYNHKATEVDYIHLYL